MDLQLLSISHRTASSRIRERFAFDDDKKLWVLRRLMAGGEIQEAVLLSTCNRTEIYCSGLEKREVYRQMQDVLLEAGDARDIPGIRDCLRRYQGRNAVHHLFQVAAGLDSVVLGEDQILGQVKQAYFLSREQGYCQSSFHSLFRLAFTGAKRVKTHTPLSRIPVSTASLALKKAEEFHGTLEGKRLMILGASGGIGSTLLKDALEIPGLEILLPLRKNMPQGLHHQKGNYKISDYGERYLQMDEMDVIISATASPHYTVTREHFLEHRRTEKKRIFFDLAVPSDIEESIGGLPDTCYCSMEDMEELAAGNNEKKQGYVEAAQMILNHYEEEFLKEELYRENRELLENLRIRMGQEAQDTSVDRALAHLVYGIKEKGNVEEFEQFIHVAAKLMK